MKKLILVSALLLSSNLMAGAKYFLSCSGDGIKINASAPLTARFMGFSDFKINEDEYTVGSKMGARSDWNHENLYGDEGRINFFLQVPANPFMIRFKRTVSFGDESYDVRCVKFVKP